MAEDEEVVAALELELLLVVFPLLEFSLLPSSSFSPSPSSPSSSSSSSLQGCTRVSLPSACLTTWQTWMASSESRMASKNCSTSTSRLARMVKRDDALSKVKEMTPRTDSSASSVVVRMAGEEMTTCSTMVLLVDLVAEEVGVVESRALWGSV